MNFFADLLVIWRGQKKKYSESQKPDRLVDSEDSISLHSDVHPHRKMLKDLKTQ